MESINKSTNSVIPFTGIASFAQERIFLDEQVRFFNKIAIYNELTALRVVRRSLSIDRLQLALRYVLNKHKVLRTSLIFNYDDGTLKQCITDKHQTFKLATELTFKSEHELQDIIYQTTIDPNLFDLSNGRVFHCQILRQHKLVNENKDDKLLTVCDVLIVAFHHVAFDRSSRQIFLNDLCTAYNSNTTMTVDEESLEYIDYTVYERLINMTLSRDFWHLQLEGYNLEHTLLLPVDRHRLSTDERSGFASVAEIYFDDMILTAFLTFASSHEVTPFQLGLATFYAFLFKLTHGQSDLCISCLNANRYRTELQNMIGMFVATLPYRIQLDSQWSFDELVKHVREKSLSILEHSNYPLQHILADSHLQQSNVEFLGTAFDFVSTSLNIDQLSFDGTILGQILLQQSFETAKFDFMLRFMYDSVSDDGRLLCYFVCSRDMFDELTTVNIARRFQQLFFQLFSSTPSLNQIDLHQTPINKLTLILPEEVAETQGILFRRQANIMNESMSFTIYNV
jgi:hypothetical protein